MKEVLRVPAGERESYLRGKGGLDEEMVKRVLEGAAALEQTVAAPARRVDPDATMASPAKAMDLDATVVAARPAAPAEKDEGFPEIRGYRMVRLLAQGGMGAVYEAVQTGEGFERRCAVKVVKPEMAFQSVLLRFLQERQVLAAFDHPSIARLYDAGATGDGAPFLAMEFVEGRMIDRYCAEENLDLDARLKLCLPLCDAIQYAHQRLVVHRDLKPGNVMVTQEGIPKLLDFGIAKLVDTAEGAAKKLSLTTVEGVPMTPMYASPEQVQGHSVTTATDLYSLAVMIYELLTGSLPYEFKQFTPAGVERTICETEPVAASAAVLKRQLAPGETEEKVRRRLKGELDLILLMALRKEPARRYASVLEFTQDIRNHMAGLPVVAHGDSVGYRVRKFAQRHTGYVAAGVLAVASLAGAAVVSTYFASVARQEQRVAVKRFQETRDLARFFINEFDDAIRAGETSARREMVAKGLTYLKRLAEEAAGDRELEREVIAGYLKLGDVQGNPLLPNLGQPEAARASYREAMKAAERFSEIAGEGFAREKAGIRRKLADLDAVGRKPKESLAVYLEVLPLFEGVERADLLNTIGFVQGNMGDDAGALRSFEEAERIADGLLKEKEGDRAARAVLLRSAERKGEALARTGKTAGAIANLNTALALLEEDAARPEGRTPMLLRRMWSATIILGDVNAGARKRAEAERSYRRSLEIVEQLRRVDPLNRQYRVDRFTTLGRLADVLVTLPGKRAEAERTTANALETLRPVVMQEGASDNEIDQYAWMALTTPFAPLRDVRGALELLERRVARSAGADPRVLDMLAMAYFQAGNAGKAMETEKRALSLIPPAASALRRELEANLKKFGGLPAATPPK